jgi:hypothetical protein
MNVKRAVKTIRLWSIALFWMFVLTTFLVIPFSCALAFASFILEIGKLMIAIYKGSKTCWETIKKGIDEGLESY